MDKQRREAERLTSGRERKKQQNMMEKRQHREVKMEKTVCNVGILAKIHWMSQCDDRYIHKFGSHSPTP